MGDDVPEQYRPRLCHIVKWADFQGYGFNLHAEKGKAGQYIGKVDENSPAEVAGLREGDRIVEVNGTNIGNENHQQVVTRIKSGGDETTLLVVDVNADNWYKEQKKVIRGELPEVIYRSAKRDENGLSGQTEPEEDPVLSYIPEPAADVLPDEPEPEPEQAVEPEPEPEPEPIVSAVAVTSEAVSSEVVNGNSEEDNEHRPRQCHLKIWPTFQGYGFNLHAERDKPGQFIGLVDDDSPASTAGLRVNDRIIEVNGVNVESETHVEVISRIKAIPGETRLLVVDRDTDAYYRAKGVTVSSTMPQTETITSPSTAPEAVNGLKSSAPEPPREPEPEYTIATQQQAVEPPKSEPVAPAATTGGDGLELNLSVAEMKERLKAKKRQDPRHNKISFEQKYKEFQRM